MEEEIAEWLRGQAEADLWRAGRAAGVFMDGPHVWVAETWRAHGYDHGVQGVYDSREAAFEGLKDRPNLTVYVGKDGNLHGRPRSEAHPRAEWAWAAPLKVQGRRQAPSPGLDQEAAQWPAGRS